MRIDSARIDNITFIFPKSEMITTTLAVELSMDKRHFLNLLLSNVLYRLGTNTNHELCIEQLITGKSEALIDVNRYIRKSIPKLWVLIDQKE